MSKIAKPVKGFELAQKLHEALASLPWQERLPFLKTYEGLKQVFSTSYSLDDQIITHEIVTHALPIEIFTLDTGRLFEEVQTLHAQTDEHYNIRVKTYVPAQESVETYVNTHGLNAFYQSAELRHGCCFIRKVEPLNRALQGVDVWVSGLRKDHSAHRTEMEFAQWDEGHEVIKVYPLLDVLEEEVKAFIAENKVPYNPLYDQGYASVGCRPCTRAITHGEDPRAGRWWWEQDEKRECGLHVVNGRLVRSKS
jgi:phosphoadenosine phosphosulfate reductase